MISSNKSNFNNILCNQTAGIFKRSEHLGFNYRQVAVLKLLLGVLSLTLLRFKIEFILPSETNHNGKSNFLNVKAACNGGIETLITKLGSISY